MDNKKAVALRLLSVLRHYYSLRDLQEILDIPFQTLWKYVNMISTPEERTSEKILSRIQEQKLIEKLIRQSIQSAEGNYNALVRNPGFLSLFALVAKDFIKGVKIGVVLPMSEYALPLATAVSMELHVDLCPSMTRPCLDKKGVYLLHYSLGGGNEIKLMAVPRSCLKDKGRGLLVDTVVESVDKVEAYVNLLKQARVLTYGIIAIALSKSVVDLAKASGIKYKSFVVIE